jgi:hypothetical protein
MWQNVREKPISLRGLDALFQVVENPSWFFLGSEIFFKARIATLMALATWQVLEIHRICIIANSRA